MKVYLNSISGIDDAMVTLMMSKRTWTAEKEHNTRDMVARVLDRTGRFNNDVSEKDMTEFKRRLKTVLNIGTKHITLLKYIDLSITVEGLHRGGQDDWDAHAERYNNRIVRASTRLARFGEEKSDFYKGKIYTTDEVVKHLGIKIPYEVEIEGQKYVKAVNGYVREDLKEDNDVLRGLYMLSIPSNFTFKVNLTEFAHVYKMRNKDTHANPEVKQCCEMICDELEKIHSELNRELLKAIEN